MGYTDKELRDATQIAYMDLLDGYDSLVSKIKPPYTIRQIIDATENKNIKEKLEKKIKEGDISIDLDSWKITQIHDKNNVNGFYGCIIETSDNEAIVAFRGSESETDEQFRFDWIDADIGLPNSTETTQQVEVNKFLREIQTNGYLDKYTTVASTGHSLGGNLSDYFTIHSVDFGLSNKIKQSINFDGPGFSQEYLELNKMQIDEVSKVMKHYQWSAVGNILFPVPGVEFIVADTKEYGDTSTYLQEEYTKELSYDLICKHDTRSLEFDDKGNIIEGKMDAFAWFLGKLTKGFDRLPTDIGNSMRDTLTYFLLHGDEIKSLFVDEKGLTKLGIGFVAGAAITVLANPLGTLATAATVIAGTVATILGGVGIECLIEKFESTIEKVSEMLIDAKEWTMDKFEEFKNFLKEKVTIIKKIAKEAAIFTINKAIERANLALKKLEHGKKIVIEKWREFKNHAERVYIKVTNLVKKIGVDVSQWMMKKLLEAKKILVKAIDNVKEKLSLAGEIAKSLGKSVVSQVKKKYESLKNVTITVSNKFAQVTSKIRDYSVGKLDELKSAYSSIISEDFFDMGIWNKKFSYEKWFNRLHISPIQSAAASLIRTVQEAGTSFLNKVTGVFDDIQEADDIFAKYLNAQMDELNTIAALLE
jgi:hypothetical protein